MLSKRAIEHLILNLFYPESVVFNLNWIISEKLTLFFSYYVCKILIYHDYDCRCGIAPSIEVLDVLNLLLFNFLTMNLIEFQFLLQWCSNLQTLGIKLDGDYTCTVYQETVFGASKRAKRAFSENSIDELWYGNQENIHRRLFLQGWCKAKEYWGKKIDLSFPRAS